MYFYISPASEDLRHYGVQGMKWGIRRYQNKFGGLTEEGKKRYALGRVAATAPHVNKAAQSVKNLKKDLKRSKKSEEDVTKMSDQELRDKINRMQLEENYNRLKESREASRGSQFVDKALDAVGDAALLAGSIASIVLLFKKAS